MNLTRRIVLHSLALTTAATLMENATLTRNAFAAPPDDSVLHDHDRPSFHLLPARGWMNDPCAPAYHRGQYHMFHQYNPHAAVWGDMHWAHATSPDMVHWTRQPVALAPTPNSSDAQGCFTGSSLLLNGQPAIIYTGVQSVLLAEATLADGHNNFRETQNLALATDATLRTWTKRPQPVIPTPPPGLHVTGFRDPTPFRIANTQYLLVGSGIAGQGGMVLLYRATTPDLTHWEYLHPLLQGQWSGTPGNNPVDTGEMWECPDFFPLGPSGQYVLIYSTQGKTLWHSGTLDPATLRFHPLKSGELDYGHGTFYAPKTQLDAHGNRILWGWLPETRPEAEYARAGWSGLMSLPRRLTLVNGDLHMEPAAETRLLRAHPNPTPNRLSSSAQEFSCVLQAAASSSPTPYTLYDSIGPLLEIRSDPAQAPRTLRLNDLHIDIPEPLSPQAGFHLFADNSVLELFVDSRFCFTRRFYRAGTLARDPAQPVATLTLPGTCRIVRPQSFAVNSVWSS